ncbi:TPA: hypothetical protein ACNRPQ_004475 [Raoultella ornithinolytica]
MLNNKDYFFINNTINSIKSTMIRLASEYGPGYSTDFLVTFEEIKTYSSRMRLTEVTINEYASLFRGHNMNVLNHPQGLLVQAHVSSILLAPNDAIALANSIETFRTRAALNGDYENL